MNDMVVTPEVQNRRNAERTRILTAELEMASPADRVELAREIARTAPKSGDPFSVMASGGKKPAAIAAPSAPDPVMDFLKGGGAKAEADDPVLAFLSSGGSKPPKTGLEQIPGMPQEQPKTKPAPSFMERVTDVAKTGLSVAGSLVAPMLVKPPGELEAAATIGTGAVAAPIGAVAGLFKGLTGGKYGTPEGVRENAARSKEIAESLTYQPKTAEGKNAMTIIGKVLDESKLAGMGPTEGITLASIAAGNVGRAAKQATRPPTPPAARAAPMGSVGAAAASTDAQALATVANASPELRSIVDAMVKKKEPINIPALERQVEADSLPVPIQLTKGQASQDVVGISNEQNWRGKNPDVAKRFNEQNTRLIDNTNAIRENAAPDVYATTIPEHGEMLIEAYRTKDAALNSVISAKYKALEDANGGAFPIDVKTFVETSDAALHKALLYDDVPPTIRMTIDRLVKNGMTFENFESLRTNLARIQRSPSADGNARAAAGVIRQSLEELPIAPGGEHLKPLADAARAASRERFALIDKDPAYKAVVSGGRLSADGFVNKYVIGADKKELETLSANLAQDQTARQVVASGVVNYLKSRAGIVGESGNFSQAGYNKALEQLRPKLEIIFEPAERKQIEALGNVARYTQAQPRGSFVNNSNTATAMMAEGAKTAVETAANVAAKGLPIGTMGRRLLKSRAERKEINETLQTGAGIRLKDVK